MRFAFTDEQVELGAAVGDLLANQCPPEALRAAWSSDDGRIPGLWSSLAAMGLAGLCVPEVHGGLGMSVLDAALPMVACGYAGVPEPVVPTVLIAPGLLAAAGRHEHLSPIAAGDTTVSAAVLDDPWFVGADAADLLMLVGHRRDREMARLAVLVDRDRVDLEPVPSVDGARRLTRGVAGRGLGDWGEVLDAPDHEIDRALDRGLVGMSCLLLGLAERMLDLTVAHVQDRQQFGVPIGSFQAIKHHCADALLALDVARPVVWRAAWSLSNLPADDPAVAVHASMAKAYASDAAAECAAQALQCHAGIGYSTEYDLHLYMKRVWTLQRAWGDAAWHRRLVASAVIEGDYPDHPAPEHP